MVFNYRTESTILKDRKAFTLVELLVVVAVLALLASIVFSNLTGAREQAKISNALSFQSNMHTLLGADLVGWWNFDEGSGNMAKDLSGYGNNGIIVGATHTDGVPGTLGSALDFTNSHSVDISHNSVQLLTTGGTISAWIYPRTLGSSNYGRIVDKSTNDGGGNGFSFRLAPNDRLRFSVHSGTRESATNSITLNSWMYVSVSWTMNGNTTFYINGEVSGPAGATGDSSMISTTNPLRIGRRSNATDYGFNGLIDDVRIYSRALTAYEVQTLYAQTKDKYLAENND